MTCATHALARPISSSRRQRVGAFLGHQWRAYLARRAQRGTVRILQGLDDATLRDIGLSRSEIDSVVYGRPDDRRLRYEAR